MRVIRTVKQMQSAVLSLKRKGMAVGLVPTMGALHEGHMRLIKACRKENDAVIVSIFVNPIQFGPSEDFSKYPRPISKDISICRAEGADYVFHPAPEEMYPAGFKTYVEVRELGDYLCGAARAGHFRGVTTVVSKLFNACLPDRAYFGMKDAQQAVIIKRMVKDLNFPVCVRTVPIVREKSGLALSSRNAYLSAEDKEDAAVISDSLAQARRSVKKGQRNAAAIIGNMSAMIRRHKNARIEYISVVDLDRLRPVKKIEGKCLIAAAVRFGKTRLIDNIVVDASG